MRVDYRSGKVLLPRPLDLAALLRHMPRAPREPPPVDVLLMLNSTRDRKLTETQSHSHHQERPDTLNEWAGIPVESFPTLDAAVERLRELVQAGKNPLFLIEGDAIPGPTRSPTT